MMLGVAFGVKVLPAGQALPLVSVGLVSLHVRVVIDVRS